MTINACIHNLFLSINRMVTFCNITEIEREVIRKFNEQLVNANEEGFKRDFCVIS